MTEEIHYNTIKVNSIVMVKITAGCTRVLAHTDEGYVWNLYGKWGELKAGGTMLIHPKSIFYEDKAAAERNYLKTRLI